MSYSSFAELSSLAYAHGATPLFVASYVRDALGRLSSKTETVAGVTVTEGYTYDDDGRLVEVTHGGVAVATAEYDGNGNRTSYEDAGGVRVAVHDDQDRLLDDEARSYTFNEAGELESWTEAATDETTTLLYHAPGGLLAVTLDDGTEIEYAVDGFGRRIGKEVDGAIERGWVYGSQLGPVAELDALGAVQSRFVYGTRSHVPDYLVRGGATYRLVSDDKGSVRLVVDVATGVVAQAIEYDAWGVVVADSSPGFQPFGYAGGLYDPDTGLVRFGERDYDAAAGRWTSKDPIGFGGGDPNLYGYVGGDPVNAIDPEGTIIDSVTSTCSRSPLLCAEAGLVTGLAAQQAQRARPFFGFLTQAVQACLQRAPALRSLTGRNFRENLGRLSGGIPKGAQAHHNLPQKFIDVFQRAGINIHDPRFGAWVDSARHGSDAYRYNRAWEAFFQNVRNPSRQQILDFGRTLAQSYGYDVGF